MSRCWECDRYAVKFTVIDGHDYCDKCAPDTGKVPATGNVARVGTVYVDPETGDHVMPPDFPGDVELRWPPDPAPVDDGAGADDAAADSGSADYQTKRDLSVPLAEQIAQYGIMAEDVLDALHANLEDEWFRHAIIRLGVERLTSGYETFGSSMYRWGTDRRDDEMLQEVADYVVYGTSGDFFRVEP